VAGRRRGAGPARLGRVRPAEGEEKGEREGGGCHVGPGVASGLSGLQGEKKKGGGGLGLLEKSAQKDLNPFVFFLSIF
jgi:hypothetical protein